MIHIDMNPVAIAFGALSIRWYSVFTALAMLVVVLWGIRAARRAGLSTDLVFNSALYAIPGGLIGARLVHVIDQLDYYMAHPGLIIGFEGLAVYGGILGAVAGVWLASRVHHFSFTRFADLVAPGALLGQATGRVGCIINGCCYGKETGLPWGLTYTHPDSYAPLGISTQPAVGYELLFDLALFALVWKLQGKLKPNGSVFLIYLALYSVGRFFVTMTRDTGPEGWVIGGWLLQAQIISVLVFVVTVPILLARTRWAGGTAQPQPVAVPEKES